MDFPVPGSPTNAKDLPCDRSASMRRRLSPSALDIHGSLRGNVSEKGAYRHRKCSRIPSVLPPLLLFAQYGESGQWIRSKAAGSPGSLSVSRGQGNQVAALVRIPPLLDGPLRAMLCPLWMSLS